MYPFFNDTATTEIYTGEDTLSLHDALPIFIAEVSGVPVNTTFGSITKPIDLLLEVIDMSADLIALIHIKSLKRSFFFDSA